LDRLEAADTAIRARGSSRQGSAKFLDCVEGWRSADWGA
jgi:hypothetical protein